MKLHLHDTNTFLSKEYTKQQGWDLQIFNRCFNAKTLHWRST